MLVPKKYETAEQQFCFHTRCHIRNICIVYIEYNMFEFEFCVDMAGI